MDTNTTPSFPGNAGQPCTLAQHIEDLHIRHATTKPITDATQSILAGEGVEEFDIEVMLIKIEAQCQKLEREWMAAQYARPIVSSSWMI